MKQLKLISVLIISSAFVACGGGSPSSSSDKPDSLLPDGYVPVSSTSSSSSSSTGNGVLNTPLPILENFNNAVDGAGFFSSAYKVLQSNITDDPQNSFYYPLAGLVENRIIVGDGKLTIGNARFSIGQTYFADATAASTTVPKNPKINSTQQNNVTTWGELDLSKDYKVSFCVVAATDNKLMQIYVDNNTAGEANSIHGGGGTGSRIFNNVIGGLVPGKRVEINIPGTTTLESGGIAVATKAALVGSATSFLQIRVESGSLVTIDDLWVGYQNDLSTEPAAGTCAAGTHLEPPPPTVAPAAPAAPTLLSGDGQITVGWASVATATSYEVFYNTSDSPDAAMAFNGNPVTGTGAIITGLVNDTPYYVFVRAANSAGMSAYSPSTSTTPAPAVPSTGTPLPFTVNLNLTKDAFFGTNSVAPAQTLTNFANLPMNFIEGGGSGITLDEVAGTITIASGGRFTIGQVSVPAPADTASTDTSVAGDLDLSQPYKIIIEVVSAADLGNFQVYIDNNTTASANSIHGSASRILNRGAVDIADSEVIEIIIDGAERVGTANSFIQLRTDSAIGAAGIVISGIRIEPLGAIEPADAWTAGALTLVGSADIAPNGSVSVNEETAVTMTATGGNLSSSAHQIFFAHQEIAQSDFMFTARIASVTGATTAVGNSYRFGLMVMSDLQPAASYADLAAWADAGFYVSAADTLMGSRANMKTDNTRSRSDIVPLVVGNYIRIEVYDDGAFKRVRRLYSTDGITYTQANSTTDFKATSATDNWFVGFYAAPGANNITIEFDNISIDPIVAL